MLAEQINLNVARNSRLPQLDLVMGRYRWLGAGATLGKALDVQSQGMFFDFTVGVLASVPLGPNYLARARIEEALQQRFQTTIDRDRIRVLILQEVYNAIDQVEMAWERVLASQQATQAATRAYGGAVRRYPAAGSLTDVLLTRGSVADAQARLVQAITDYQVDLANLAVATRTMLGYGQVDLGPPSGLQLRHDTGPWLKRVRLLLMHAPGGCRDAGTRPGAMTSAAPAGRMQPPGRGDEL